MTTNTEDMIPELININLEKKHELIFAKRKMLKCIQQINLLDKTINRIVWRYQKAKDEGNRCFRYNLRVRLTAIEGVRDVYYECLRKTAADINTMRRALYNQTFETTFFSDDDSSDDDTADDNIVTADGLITMADNFWNSVQRNKTALLRANQMPKKKCLQNCQLTL